MLILLLGSLVVGEYAVGLIRLLHVANERRSKRIGLLQLLLKPDLELGLRGFIIISLPAILEFIVVFYLVQVIQSEEVTWTFI